MGLHALLKRLKLSSCIAHLALEIGLKQTQGGKCRCQTVRGFFSQQTPFGTVHSFIHVTPC